MVSLWRRTTYDCVVYGDRLLEMRRVPEPQASLVNPLTPCGRYCRQEKDRYGQDYIGGMTRISSALRRASFIRTNHNPRCPAVMVSCTLQ